MNIPQNAINYVQTLKTDIDMFKEDYFGSLKKSFDTHHKLFYEEVGRRTGARGPILYNPFGGIDVGTQFSLSDDISTVVSQGCDAIGHPSNIGNFLSMFPSDAFDIKSFDDTRYLKDRVLYGGGLGGEVFARLMMYFAAEPTGLFYFDLDENSNPDFYVSNPFSRTFNNAVITFEHEGKERKLVYLAHTMDNYESSRFYKFVNDLEFDTMLLKAAFMWWSDFKSIEPLLHMVIDPARDKNARVITDANNQLLLFKSAPRERPIWRTNYTPNSFDIEDLEGVTDEMKFGYSTRVYFGDGKDLITRDDQVLKLLLSKIARQERSRAILSRPIAKS